MSEKFNYWFPKKIKNFEKSNPIPSPKIEENKNEGKEFKWNLSNRIHTQIIIMEDTNRITNNF